MPGNLERPRRARRLWAMLGGIGSLGAAVTISGCGYGGGDPAWIGPDAAVVQCVISGRTHLQAPLVAELPTVDPPTGMYGRKFDPFALDDLGYQRDSAVCATLEAPTESQITGAQTSIAELTKVRAEANREAAKEGRCVCQALQELDRDEMIPMCVGRPTRKDCEVGEAELARAREIVAPIEEAIAEVHVPLVHWRLVGAADRPDRFAARQSELIKLHPGGSEVYLEGAPIVGRGNHELLEALLALEDVTAVVRQDSGRGLLVVRKVSRGQLVLDHFSYPKLGAGVQPLIPHIDNGQIERFKQALEPPAQTRKMLFDPSAGTVFELDRDALDRVDRGIIEATGLAGEKYAIGRETRTVPQPLATRVAMQVPIGLDGAVLRIKIELSTEGELWLNGLGQDDVFMNLSKLRQQDVAPEFHAGGKDPGFVLRGTPIEQSIFAGINAAPGLFETIEHELTGTVQGKPDDWSVQFPSGPLPGELDTRPGLQRLRERLSKTPHVLTVKRDGNMLTLELKPS